MNDDKEFVPWYNDIVWKIGERIIPIIFLLLAICSPFAFWAIRSNYEAEAYNRLTGAHVTMLDAMFLEFRVEGKIKNEE